MLDCAAVGLPQATPGEAPASVHVVREVPRTGSGTIMGVNLKEQRV